MSISTRSTRAFLRQYREPTAVVRRVDEVVSLDDDELVRSVRLEMNGNGGQETFVEVLRPHKGRLAGLRIEDSSVPVARLGHDEHHDLAVQLICARWASMARRLRVPPWWNASMQTAFALDLLAFLEILKGLPRMSEEKAGHAMKASWQHMPLGGAPTWVPTLFLRHRGLGFSAEEVGLLHQLCTLFSERYSIILRAAPSAEPLQLSYVYRQKVTDSFGVPTGPDPVTRPRRFRSWARATIRSFFGARPATVRIHVPLARKAAQYTLSIDAPDDCFFSKAGLLTDASTHHSARDAIIPVRQGVAWASSITYGRRVSLFIDPQRVIGSRLYVGADLKELPSRSTFRAWSISSVLVLVAMALGTVGYVGRGSGSDVPALVAALTGLASVGAAEIAPSRGVIGTPVLARLSFYSFPIIATALSVWLVTLTVEPVPTWDWLPDIVERVAVDGSAAWNRAGGALAMAAASLLFIWLTGRIFRVGSIYRHVKAGRGDRNHLYD